MIKLLRRIITYPRRKREREQQRLTTLREREAFRHDARDHQNVRISKKIGDGEFVVIRDFDPT